MAEAPKPPEKKENRIKAWFYRKFSLRRKPDDEVLKEVPVIREKLEDGKKEVKSSIITTDGKDLEFI